MGGLTTNWEEAPFYKCIQWNNFFILIIVQLVISITFKLVIFTSMLSIFMLFNGFYGRYSNCCFFTLMLGFLWIPSLQLMQKITGLKGKKLQSCFDIYHQVVIFIKKM